MDQCLDKMNIDQNEVNRSNDTNSVEEVTLSTPWPNVISLVLIFISSLGIIRPISFLLTNLLMSTAEREFLTILIGRM